MYKLVIFDFDGTLADTFEWFVKTTNEASTVHNFLPISDTQRIKTLSAKEIISYLEIPKYKVPLLTSHFRSRMRREIHHIHAFPDAKAALERLHKKSVQLALVSSNSRENIRIVLGDDCMNYFSHYECGVSIFNKTQKLKKTIKALKASKQETLYVADEIRDADAAKKADIHFGAVSWGYNSASVLHEKSPTHTFHTFNELLSCLLHSRPIQPEG